MTRPDNLVRTEDVPVEEIRGGEVSHMLYQRLGKASGGAQLGCSVVELPPGKRSWPYHYHLGNEEAVYVLDGSGTVRYVSTGRGGQAYDRDSVVSAIDDILRETNSSIERTWGLIKGLYSD